MKFKIEEFIKKHRKFVQYTGKAKPCIDHLGNKFNTYKDMCFFHGIHVETFRYRKNILKLSIEKCLAPVKLEPRYSKKL